MSLPLTTSIEKNCIKTGYGIFSKGKKKIAVKGAYEGELIDYTLSKNKKEIETFTVLKAHPGRIDVPCEHSSICSGCSLAGLQVESQLEWKKNKIETVFPEYVHLIRPMIQNPQEKQYRNKAELTFSQNLAGDKNLGFIRYQSRGFAFSLTQCFLLPDWMIEAAKLTHALFLKYPIEAFYLPKLQGDLKNLLMRSNQDQSEALAAIVIQNLDKKEDPFFVEWQQTLEQFFFEKKIRYGLYLIEQKTEKGRETTWQCHHVSGEEKITQKVMIAHQGQQIDVQFPIHPLSFFQPNPFVAPLLYQQVMEDLELNKNETLLDLYCGVGTFGLIASAFCKEVIGIELIQSAVKEGQELIKQHGIQNMRMECIDVKKWVLLPLSFQIDAVIVDPPRVGLGREVVEAIARMQPKKIAYVSCNPASQKEDVEMFATLGFHPVKITPVDQFTHTPHLENVILLKRL